MLFSQHFSFPCQYHSTIAPYTSIHLPPTLYNVFLPALQLSPVSIIPPLLHTHSSIYHPRCIMLFSQHFSFPCQYHSTIAPYSFIYHPHCTMFFSQHFSFPLSVSSHHCSILSYSPTTNAIQSQQLTTPVYTTLMNNKRIITWRLK